MTRNFNREVSGLRPSGFAAESGPLDFPSSGGMTVDRNPNLLNTLSSMTTVWVIKKPSAVEVLPDDLLASLSYRVVVGSRWRSGKRL